MFKLGPRNALSRSQSGDHIFYGFYNSRHLAPRDNRPAG